MYSIHIEVANMTEQIDVSSRIDAALAGLLERLPEGGRTGNYLGPIRAAKVTACVGEVMTAVEVVVMSDNGPDAMIATSDDVSGKTYYHCSNGRWTTEGSPVGVERATELCTLLSVAAIEA